MSADTDSGTLLARRNTAKPSFVLFRHTNELTPDNQVEILANNLDAVEDELASGAIVTILPERLRVRKLRIFP